MPRPARLLALCLALFTFVAGCGGGSTSPEDDGPAAFSRSMGTNPNDETIVMGVAVLSDGTRMVCGEFDGVLHVTGYPDSILAGGSERCFFAGFRPDGSVSLLTQLAGGAVGMRHMVRDPDDNLLLVGSFGGSTNFGGVAHTAVGEDVIFAKLDRTGNAMWVQAASASGADRGLDIAAARDGSVYIVGLASGEMSVGGEDVGQTGHTTGFMVKLRSDGVGEWTQTAAVTGASSTCRAVAVSADGTVVACGDYDSPTLEFAGDILDHGSGTFDAFIGRFAADGTRMGNIHIRSAGAVSAVDVTTINNDAIVTGFYDATTNFDANGAGFSIKADGSGNAFVARYSEAGELRWVKSFKPGDNQDGLTIAPLAGGRILVGGQFEGTIKLGSTTFTSLGSVDMFVARLDGDGNVLSASRIGGPGEEDGLIATTTGSTAVIVGGGGSDQITFPDGSRRTRRGDFDGYIFQQP